MIAFYNMIMYFICVILMCFFMVTLYISIREKIYYGIIMSYYAINLFNYGVTYFKMNEIYYKNLNETNIYVASFNF